MHSFVWLVSIFILITLPKQLGSLISNWHLFTFFHSFFWLISIFISIMYTNWGRVGALTRSTHQVLFLVLWTRCEFNVNIELISSRFVTKLEKWFCFPWAFETIRSEEISCKCNANLRLFEKFAWINSKFENISL